MESDLAPRDSVGSLSDLDIGFEFVTDPEKDGFPFPER